MAEETQQTTARLEARLPNDVHALLKRAAESKVAPSPILSYRRRVKPLAGPSKRPKLFGSPSRPTANRRSPSKPLEPTPALKKAFSAAVNCSRRGMTFPFRLEPLGGEHERALFHGEDALDHYFQTQVTQDIRRHIANCFVAVEAVTSHVAAYYTISAASIPLIDLPREDTKRLPRYPTVPAVRIGRLAVDQRFQGRGLDGRSWPMLPAER